MELLAPGERVEVLLRCSEQAVPTARTLPMMALMVPESDLPTLRVVEKSPAGSAMMHLEMFFVLEPEAEVYYVGLLLSTMRFVEHSSVDSATMAAEMMAVTVHEPEVA